MTVRILLGDVRDKLKELPDESVHCVVSSPPYFGLRDYGTASWLGGDPACDHAFKSDAGSTSQREGRSYQQGHPSRQCKCGAVRTDQQIGLEATPEAYVAVMVEVFREVRRVLRKDGTLFLNLGDSYYSNPSKGGSGTFNGRNGRGEGYARGLRAAAYDKGGKAHEGSPARGCFCRSLCGACREAYRIGRVHSDRSPDPMLPSSNSSSSRERRVSPSGHLPMSGSIHPDDRNSSARQDQQLSPVRVAGQPLSSPASTPDESSPQLPAGFHQLAQPSECRLCGCSLADCVPASAHTAACICGTADGASADRTTDRDVSGSYPHLTTTALKPKDIIGIPWRVAFALQADGWYLRQDIIWAKPNPMPESVTDRCTKAHEYLFLLSKSPHYHFDAEAIAEASLTPMTDGYAASGTKDAAARNTDPMRTRVAGSCGAGATRNRRSVWTVATAPFSGAHFAVFPPDLVEPCILAGCPKDCCAKCGAPVVRQTEKAFVPTQNPAFLKAGAKGIALGGWETPRGNTTAVTTGWAPSCACNADTVPGTCLDPFGGAGTTGLVADRLQRDAILIELNPAYLALASDRITDDAPLFAKVVP